MEVPASNEPVVSAGTFPPNSWFARLLAGTEAGVLAGLMIAGWFVFENWRTARMPWVIINLLSTPLLGRNAWVVGLSGATIIGLALLLVSAGVNGAVFAVLLPPRTRPLLAANAGLLFSFSCFALDFLWVYPRYAPMVARNAPRLQFAGAHFLMGMVLGLYPDLARALTRHPQTALSTQHSALSTEPALSTETEPPPSTEPATEPPPAAAPPQSA